MPSARFAILEHLGEKFAGKVLPDFAPLGRLSTAKQTTGKITATRERTTRALTRPRQVNPKHNACRRSFYVGLRPPMPPAFFYQYAGVSLRSRPNACRRSFYVGLRPPMPPVAQ